jgi:arsenate reductase
MRCPVRVLFICHRNAIRSQMAEGLLRRLGGRSFYVRSAGIQAEPVDLLVIEMMAKLGIDISGHMSKSIDYVIGQDFDYIITLCSKAQLHLSEFSGCYEHLQWHLPDPTEFQGNDDNKRQLLRILCVDLIERIRMWVDLIEGEKEQNREVGPDNVSQISGKY